MRVLDEVDVFGGELDRLVHRKVRVEHDHRGHELGDGGDRRGLVGVLREKRLARLRIEHQHAGGLHVGRAILGEFRGHDLGGMGGLVPSRGRRVQRKRGQQEGGEKSGHGFLDDKRAGDTIANNPYS